MKKILLFALTLLASTAAHAQWPSHITPLVPCRIYDSATNLSANSTTWVTVRGVCNVPEEANAVTVSIHVSDANVAGYALLYPADVLRPSPAETLFFQAAGPHSTGTLWRICDNSAEGCFGTDGALYMSQPGRVRIDVTGYSKRFDPDL